MIPTLSSLRRLSWRQSPVPPVTTNSWWPHQMEAFPRYWPFVRGIHRSPLISPRKGQWRGALVFSLISAWTNGWVNNREAGDLRRHRAHHNVTVISHHGSYLFHWVLVEFIYGHRSQTSNAPHSCQPIEAFSEEHGGPRAAVLTQWGRDKMDAISQTTYSNAFSWIKMFQLRFKFHLSLFPRVQKTIFQADGKPLSAIIWTNDDYHTDPYICVTASVS